MKWPEDFINKILQGDALDRLKNIPNEMIQTTVTSPPYWGLRDYGVAGQFGLEPKPEKYVEKIVEIFKEIKRTLKSDGTVWLNIGDSYAFGGCGSRNPLKWPKQSRNDHQAEHKKKCSSLRPKNVIGIPWRVAFALQADGWYLRQDIIWSKNNPMPESVKDRCTKSHDYIFLLSKKAKYYYDYKAIMEPASWNSHNRGSGINPKARNTGVGLDRASKVMPADHRNSRGRIKQNESFSKAITKRVDTRNKRSVWNIQSKPFRGAHFATFPPALPEICIKAGSKEGDIILDPFFGSGTTGQVAQALGRKWIGIELNKEYIKIAETRLLQKPEIKKYINQNQLKLFNEI